MKETENRTAAFSHQNPLRDGDELPHAGCYFVNANSTSKTWYLMLTDSRSIQRAEVYWEWPYGRTLSTYAYNVNGNKGIACGLNNLQKIKDGEPLGGKASAESDFATEEDDDFLS